MTTREPYPRSAYAPQLGMYATQPLRAPRRSLFSQVVYLFAWSLIGVSAVAGGLFSLYRNDVLLEQAQKRGLEAPYLAVERKLLGSPGWGTPRSLSQVLSRAEALEPTASAKVLSVAAAEPARPAAAPAPAQTQTAPRPSENPQPATAEGLKITSLDALTPLPAQRAQAPSAARALAPRPQRAVVASEPRPAAPVRVAHESEPAKPPRAEKASVAPAKVAAPAKPAPKAPPPPVDDNPLKAAIRSVIIKDQSSK